MGREKGRGEKKSANQNAPNSAKSLSERSTPPPPTRWTITSAGIARIGRATGSYAVSPTTSTSSAPARAAIWSSGTTKPRTPRSATTTAPPAVHPATVRVRSATAPRTRGTW